MRQLFIIMEIEEMNYNHQGRTGLKVNPITLGCMNFGELTDEQGPQSPDMAKGNGTAGEIIGNWLAQDKSRRDKIVLATKVYQPMDTGPNDKYLSAYHIRQACEASLRRLKTDHIDLYQMHHVDRSTPWEEIWLGPDYCQTGHIIPRGIVAPQSHGLIQSETYPAARLRA